MQDLSDQMKADALEGQRFSRKHLVLELDFSAASIEELESQVESIEYALPGGNSEENVELLTRIWGAYLGEALIKARGGHWHSQTDGRPAVLLGEVATYPHEQVRTRLTSGGNLFDYFQRLCQQP